MLNRLHQSISIACPIDGVSGAQGNVRIDFRPEATPVQRAAAQSVVDSFDWSQAAHDAWLEDQKPERKAVRQAAAQAISDNNTFLALGPAATAAQISAQVRRLTTQMNAVIRRITQID